MRKSAPLRAARPAPSPLFDPDAIFHESRSTLTLSRADGRTPAPVLLHERGCRLTGRRDGRPFALVLDSPDPDAFRAYGNLPAGLITGEERALDDGALLWTIPILAAFDRWEREIPGATTGSEVDLEGTRMEATLCLATVAAARRRGGAGEAAARDTRSYLEGRVTVSLRSGERVIAVESARWARVPASGDPGPGALAAWDGAATEACRRGLELLDAVPPPAMEAPALFTPSAAGILLHEVCGHLLEGDLVSSGASPFGSLLGERVAHEGVTLSDAPRLEAGRVRMMIDDEGEPSRETILVESGLLRGFLTDRRTAAVAGGITTGNARRESYRHPALPRMTNLRLAAGDQDAAGLARPIGRGLLVERLGRGQVDPRRGEFRLEVEAGRLIEGGVAGRPVASAFLIGSCRDLLRSIDGVGADAAVDPGAGVCIKDDQVVPVGQMMPSVRVARVRIVPGAAP